MKVNVGRLDQILRLGISLILIYIGFIDQEFIPDKFSSYIIGIIGVINFVVSLIRYCPFYAFTGINTSQSKKQ